MVRIVVLACKPEIANASVNLRAVSLRSLDLVHEYGEDVFSV